jgi:hypothetical protein
MLETILQDFADLMKVRVLEISAEFEKNLDFSALEIAITQELAILGAALQKKPADSIVGKCCISVSSPSLCRQGGSAIQGISAIVSFV